MSDDAIPDELQHLQRLRESVLWKVEGLDEAALRRPMTPTGTTLLGLVKHLAACEFGYLQMCFGRPVPDHPMLAEDTDPQDDFVVTADETAEGIVVLYRQAAEAGDRTVAELGLDAVGHVPWWGNRTVTVRQVLLHLAVETARHAGHLDILRELADGRAGWHPEATLLPSDDPAYWEQHTERQRLAARAADSRP